MTDKAAAITIRLLMKRQGISVCRSCSAPIEWFSTPSGRLMPMNAGAVHLRTEGGGPNPEIGVFDAGDSHFATCPQAATHRRAR